MADAVEFDVLREHRGDKPYKAGDTRVAVAADVANLVQLQVLRPKAEQPLQNKMEAAPLNKAAPKLTKKA